MARIQGGHGRAGALVALLILAVVAVVTLSYFMDRGPREIDVADLERAARTVKESTEDASVTAKVKAAFALSKNVPALEIDVDSRDGQVTLTGEVPTAAVKAHAGRIAFDTAGVETVDNRLLVVGDSDLEGVVEGNERLADLELRAMIYEKLFRDPDLLGRNFTVAVEDGVVILTGLVPSESDRAQAEAIVSSVAGVAAVDNRLRVTS